MGMVAGDSRPAWVGLTWLGAYEVALDGFKIQEVLIIEMNRPWKYTSIGKGLKFPCKWVLAKNNLSNVILVKITLESFLFQCSGWLWWKLRGRGIRARRMTERVNRPEGCEFRQRDLLWRGQAGEGYGDRGPAGWFHAALLSLPASPTYFHPRQIEAVDIGLFGSPYPQFALFKWLQWSEQKNLLNHISSILNDAIFFILSVK